MTSLRGILAILIAAQVAMPTVHADDSWVGKTIIIKRYGVKFGPIVSVTKEPVVFGELKSITCVVRGEHSGFLRVHESGKEGWFPKSEAVLIENAVEFFTDAIRNDPKDVGAYACRAEAWKWKGELDIAIKDYDEAIRLAPMDAENWTNRGVAWSDKKEYDKAIKDYEEAIHLDPKHVGAFINRGIVWGEKKEYDKAIKDFDEAIHLDPKYVFAFINRGIVWGEKKEYDKAIMDYDEAIRLDPKYVFAYINRGIVWREKKEYDKAAKDFDVAIWLDPKFAGTFYVRGFTWSEKREYDKAIKDYDEAIRLDPKYADAFNGKAWLFGTCPDAKIRDGKKAVEAAIKACELTGWKDSGAMDTLAAAYAETGDFDKAVAEQTKALADKALDRDYREEMEKRLTLYKQKKPYRDE